MPLALRELWDEMESIGNQELRARLFLPNGKGAQSTELALQLVRDAVFEAPVNLLPLVTYCDGSLAAVVCDRPIDHLDNDALAKVKVHEVVRWHLGWVPAEHQAELLDLEASDFIASLNDELSSREQQREHVLDATKEYYDSYVVHGRTPRADAVRPIQLACQNVIIGLAVIRHDQIFDGLRVEAYCTCEVAHLAAGEADRALASILLCDAFRSGGTMELRFGPEESEQDIPSSLVRFGRVRDVELGQTDRCSISPFEARELFLAVTPLRGELGFRAFDAIDRGVISPERLCFSLMAGIWNDLEAAFILATSDRARSIFLGGADLGDRLAQSAERETSRCALLGGMLYDRLSKGMAVRSDISTIQVDEDDGAFVDWEISDHFGFITFEMPGGLEIPWVAADNLTEFDVEKTRRLRIVPRSQVIQPSLDWLAHAAAQDDQTLNALVLPLDLTAPQIEGVVLLRCPLSIAELDEQVAGKMQSLRVGRK
jgi:hypothetical protein